MDLKQGMDNIKEVKPINFSLNIKGILEFHSQTCLVDQVELKDFVLREAHNSKLAIHSRVAKNYKGLKDPFWWLDMKKDAFEHLKMTNILRSEI